MFPYFWRNTPMETYVFFKPPIIRRLISGRGVLFSEGAARLTSHKKWQLYAPHIHLYQFSFCFGEWFQFGGNRTYIRQENASLDNTCKLPAMWVNHQSCASAVRSIFRFWHARATGEEEERDCAQPRWLWLISLFFLSFFELWPWISSLDRQRYDLVAGWILWDSEPKCHQPAAHTQNQKTKKAAQKRKNWLRQPQKTKKSSCSS